jgi:hypothetical protein
MVITIDIRIIPPLGGLELTLAVTKAIFLENDSFVFSKQHFVSLKTEIFNLHDVL